MNEKKLTDEEIVMSLECCSSGLTGDACRKCPLRGECVRNSVAIEEYALDLINRQKAEIERLTEEIEQSKNMYDDIRKCNEILLKEDAELQKQVDELTDKLGMVLSEIKADELLVAKGIEQAIKDTAKKIWDDITSHYFGLRMVGNCTVELDKLAEFWHKRGVEVE